MSLVLAFVAGIFQLVPRKVFRFHVYLQVGTSCKPFVTKFTVMVLPVFVIKSNVLMQTTSAKESLRTLGTLRHLAGGFILVGQL